MSTLRKANLDSVTEVTRRTLENIFRSWRLCQIFASRIHRFKFTLRDDAQFNNTIFFYLFRIDKKNVFFVVDEANRCQAAHWFPSVNAENI